MTHKKKTTKGMVAGNIIMWIVALLFLFPALWIVLCSFKPGNELFSIPPTLFPENPSFASYLTTWQENNFLQYFVNRRTKKQSGLDRSRVPEFVFDGFYSFLMKKVREVDHIASVFRYYRPFGDIFEEAGYGRELISLNAIFGEGWLLPAEIASYCRHGVNNVISLQPFGCIANHIVERGIENKIKKTYHNINLLSIDFDSGVSDVNIVNRLLLFLDNIRMPDQSSTCHPERSEGSVTPSPNH